ncbi:MAG: PLP-dependent aminotransferase family protein [Alphaproteobacteria bacterium]|nr:PLP-dependent aminotransferase family protein [Alphaproteobacteria bacterium]
MIIQANSSWRPRLSKADGALHQQLVEALARDIGRGVLAAGSRMPTHRALAYDLKLGLGTVTRAYREAEARGLLTSHVGRGTFVADAALARSPNAPIYLSHNLGPVGPAASRLNDVFARLAKRRDLADELGYAPPAGPEAHRHAGAAWLGRTASVGNLDWARLLVCGGAQQAMAMAFQILCRPGDVILTEAATFVGTKLLAEQMGYRLHGVALDDQGMRPDSLADVAKKTGARVAYIVPTFQNPTGRIMGLRRREEIAHVARAHGIDIVEDDIYAPFAAGPAHPSLSTFAPERTFYVTSVSKVLGPGLRAGYLLAPDDARFESLSRVARAISYSPPALGSLIATLWINDGTADQIRDEARAEIVARRSLAARILGDAVEMGRDNSPHVWLPMPELDAERLAAATAREGVQVTPPTAMITDSVLISGVRLCLGACEDRAGIERGLSIVAASLRKQTLPNAMNVI